MDEHEPPQSYTVCAVYGAEHQFEYVREDYDGDEFYECECGAQARNAREADLPIKAE